MIPSLDDIKRWSEDTGDGWVRMPASAYDSVMWLLGKAETADAVLVAARRVYDDTCESARREGRPAVTLASGSALEELFSALGAFEEEAA